MTDKTINGLGDISISTLWSPFKESDEALKSLNFIFGVTLPTGDPADQPLTGTASPSVFQLGTGAYQMNLGTSYSWGENDWNYRVNFNTSLPIDESSDGFKPATIYTAGFSAGRAINDKLNLTLGINLTHSENDKFNGSELVTGYTTVATKLGLSWKLNDDYSLASSVSIPVYRDVNQTQLAAGTLFQLGVRRSF